MRANSAGHAPAPGTTARPADKGTEPQELDPALMRRTVGAVVTVTGCRRSEARERIAAWMAGGRPLGDLEAWLRTNYRIDPTGVTAVRNVSRGVRSDG